MAPQLRKVSSGIKGLDDITGGGLPAGRPTLLCGGPGSGKTLLAASFIVHGARHSGEPGVYLSFEERESELEANTTSLGFGLSELQQQNLIALDYVHIDRQEIHETGEYDLEGLFIRLGFAIDKVKARRVVLDGIDTLFAGIPNEAILRSELRRLFTWLKDRDLSTIVTAESGGATLTRHGIEEYVSDCVIVLEQRVAAELATRRLRIVKYRGSVHGTNEYPFLIDGSGISLMPITSLGLTHRISHERISSGVSGLDAMLGGQGYFRGSSILISGGPGSGKTSIGAQFTLAAAARGERCLYLAFEESEPQLVRNMRSIGIDLKPAIDAGRLSVRAIRPTSLGMELHLTRMFALVQEANPDVVVIDPLSALEGGGTLTHTGLMLLRLIDYLKERGTTALYLNLQDEYDPAELDISSIMDSWIKLRHSIGERELKRSLYIVKSRGMAHSGDVRAMVMGSNGVEVSERQDAS